MKTKIIFTLLLAVLFCQNNAALAQAQYYVFSYMKVAPGMDGEYLKLEKAWKKIHLKKQQALQLKDWNLTKLLPIFAADAGYNYVTCNAFKTETQLAEYLEKAYLPDDWTSLLTPDEIALVARTDNIRTVVKQEVWSVVDRTLARDFNNAQILVFNYFSFPEGGSHDKHVKAEREIWKPMHEARIGDSGMKGWELLQLTIPIGADQPYQDATIDLYGELRQHLGPTFEKYFERIHQGKDVDLLLKQTNEAATLTRGEVRIVLDRL